jgi:glycosyltransferase involved in cell wall biosynthesis
MHVLQVTPRYPPNMGGVEIVVQRMSEVLAASGMQVTVYSVDLRKDLFRQQEVNSVLVKRFTPLFGDPLYFPEPQFILSLRREKADIIHVHNIHVLPPLLAAAFKHRKQRLVMQAHYHRFGQSVFRHSLLKLYGHVAGDLVFSRADVTIANSVYEKTILHEDFPEFKNIVLIPQGIDVEEVKGVKRRPASPNRILYVGALERYKNVDKILEGFGCLIKEKNTESRLVIVGRGSQRNFLINLAHDLGIASYVEWKSDLSRQQLLNEYGKASVLILLSPLESFSRVVYEALLIGVPVIVLNFGALANLVKAGLAEGINSLDPKEIARALLRAMEKTPSKTVQNLDSFLDWSEYSKRIIDLYSKML